MQDLSLSCCSFCPKRQDMQKAVLSKDVTIRPLLIMFNLTLSTEGYQRTETPDLFVNILDAIFIEASSWNSNFAAYGI
jgi:hypothetical protein